MDGGWVEQLGFGIPSIKAASASGVNTAPSASRSSWLSSDRCPLDCAKLRCELAEGCQLGVPLLLQLLLLGITAFRIVHLSSTIHLLDLLNITSTITSAKAQKKVLTKITNPSLVSMFLNVERPVPLPTMEGKLQAFLRPYYDGVQLKETVFFLDSGEHLRRCQLLHNTLTS